MSIKIDDEFKKAKKDVLQVEQAKNVVWRLWCEAFPQFKDTWQTEMLGTVICVTPKRWKIRLWGFLDPGLSAVRVEMWPRSLRYMDAIHVYHPRFKELGLRIAADLAIHDLRVRDWSNWSRRLEEYFKA